MVDLAKGRWPTQRRRFLDVRGVSLQYKTRDHLVTATYRVDFQIFAADRFILLEPSGCGKSTLLKAVGGYMSPVEGEIRLDGEVVSVRAPIA
jgi:NitT/TauT family transport system ATP-binding protein